MFLRPKRFGKSVVCSMLAHHCDINLKDRLECDAVVSVQVYDGNLAPVVETDGYFSGGIHDGQRTFYFVSGTILKESGGLVCYTFLAV